MAEAVGSLQPFYLAYQGLNDRALQKTYGAMLCQLIAAHYPQWTRPASPLSPQSSSPLRLACALPPAPVPPHPEAQSYAWWLNFIQALLERDMPQLGIRIPSTALRRCWTMRAHVHGQHWNAADLARSLSVEEDTARRYLDVLTGAFMIRQLPPWFENTGKRLVKAPKVYFRDTGILHALLGLETQRAVQSHPKLGLSWEGFALEEVIRRACAEREAYFYKTHGGAELDLLLLRNGKRYGFECKYHDAPRPTRSIHQVIQDLDLERVWIVYPGSTAYPLTETINV